MVSTINVGSTGTLKFSLNVGPGFKLGASPAAATVPHGLPANFTVTVTPQFGSFNDPIALSCSVDPVGPMCSLSDPSVTPGAAPTSVTLKVATTNVADLKMPGSNPPLFAWIAVPTFGFLVVGTMSPGRKKTRQGIFLALLLMLVLLGMLVACGGGSSGSTSPPPPPPPPPPPGSKTYTITVVGTSGMISQQTTTSLTVTP